SPPPLPPGRCPGLPYAAPSGLRRGIARPMPLLPGRCPGLPYAAPSGLTRDAVMSTDDRREEERIASFLHTVQRDMPPPNQAFLDELRERPAEAYQAACAAPPTKAQAPRRPWRRRLAAVAGLAAALLLGVGGYFLLTPRPTAVALGDVLRKVADADGVHL